MVTICLIRQLIPFSYLAAHTSLVPSSGLHITLCPALLPPTSRPPTTLLPLVLQFLSFFDTHHTLCLLLLVFLLLLFITHNHLLLLFVYVSSPSVSTPLVSLSSSFILSPCSYSSLYIHLFFPFLSLLLSSNLPSPSTCWLQSSTS